MELRGARLFALASTALFATACSSSAPGGPSGECGAECLEAGRCDDGVDNDDDGLVDCEDAACTNDPACWAFGLRCATGTISASGTAPWHFRGLLGAGASFASASCGGDGPEAVVTFRPPRTGTYHLAASGSGFDALVYVRKNLCSGPELICDATPHAARAAVFLKASQTAVVFVDSAAGASGEFALDVWPADSSTTTTSPCDGTLVCGVGECAREVPACTDGRPATCVPGDPRPERCDGFDDDCDGEIDEVPECAELPPDPSTVAPPLDPMVMPTFAAAVEFLYTGDHPIQRGVRPGTIDADRLAVLHGHVADRTGAPIGGVRVGVHGRPELGWTLTRADGKFDLAVNGGGVMVVDYTHDGHLPASRQANVPWHEHVYLEDLVLVAPDPNVTVVDLASSTTVQVAEGSPVSDSSGTRRATVLFPPGTTAELQLPDGSRRPIPALSVRATEYTVGDSGPAAMPAKLPPTSAYTYAVELGADEATAAGAEHVVFSRPLPLYVENFLRFPVGSSVPVGYYDRKSSSWVALDSGRVVGITAIGADGEAELDVDGDGDSDADDRTLEAELGIDGAERSRVGELYLPGQSLWRATVPHFSIIDLNWLEELLDDVPDFPEPDVDKKDDDDCKKGGSIIGAQDRSLGEVLPVFGTPFTLRYDSTRTLGRKDGVDLRLTRENIPASMTRIDLHVVVAGQYFMQSFSPQPNLTTRFSWNGLDVYGRKVAGPTWAAFWVGFAYPAEYYDPARFGAVAGGGRTGVPARGEIVLMRGSVVKTEMSTGIPTVDARAFGLGGFSLSAHHVFDRAAGVLYEGGGETRKPTAEAMVSLAGSSRTGTVAPTGLATDAEGSVYFADPGAGVVRKVDRAGRVSRVAGGRPLGLLDSDLGDGGPATEAGLAEPREVAVDGQGNVFIAESGFIDLDSGARFGSLSRIRKVWPDGHIETLAGGLRAGCIDGEGRPAKGACLPTLSPGLRGPHLAVDATGHLFVGGQSMIRRIDPDGHIWTVAGGPHAGMSWDGDRADQDHTFGVIDDLVVDQNGNLIVADDGHRRIRWIDAASWRVWTIAGCGPVCFPRTADRPGVGAGCRPPPSYPAHTDDQARFGCARWAAANAGRLGLGPNQETSLAVLGADIVVLGIRPWEEQVTVWRFTPGDFAMPDLLGASGRYEDVGVYHDGLDPANEDPRDVRDLAISPSGELAVARPAAVRLARRRSTLDVPSSGGDEIYRFDAEGRHLETLGALTGATKLRFGYDARGLLTNVVDGDGNLTRIDRDPSGKPTAIVAPGGQVTALEVGPDGYLASLTDPEGGRYSMTYRSDGLLETFTSPRGDVSRMTYDQNGALRSDTNSAGGGWSVEREGTSRSSTVTMTSAAQATTRYGTARDTTTVVRRTTRPDGSVVVRRALNEHANTLILPSGAVVRATTAPDPRFGRDVPRLEQTTFRLPSGLERSTTVAREVEVAAAGVARISERVDDNGDVSTRVYDGATRTWTLTSPEGRTTSVTLDERERPIELVTAGRSSTRLTYDARGRLQTVTRSDGREDQTVTMAYAEAGPAAGYLEAMTDALGQTTTFLVDARGAHTEERSPGGRVLAAAYDASGRPSSVTPPGRPAYTLGWTATGRLALEAPPPIGAGDPATRLSYDLDDQLVRVERPGGVVIGRSYGPGGRLVGLTTPEDVLTYTYDGAGQLAGASNAAGDGLVYEYDGDLATSVRATGRVPGELRLTYDRSFRVVESTIVGHDGLDRVTVDYDRDGLATRLGAMTLDRDLASGAVTGSTLGLVADQTTYDAFGRISTYSADFDGAALYTVSFQRDPLDRIVERVETVDGVTTTSSHRYDVDGRLVAVDRGGVRLAEYGYDDNGNRVLSDEGAVARAATFDDQDRLLSDDRDVYTYTPSGALETRTTPGGEVTRYTYDALGNLRRVELAGGSVIEYLVDAANHRIAKVVDGVRVRSLFYGDSDVPRAELDEAGSLVARFVFLSGRLAYLTKNGRTYRVITDVLGSVRLVVDAESGAVAQRLDYDPWGRVLEDTSPGFQPFGFAGGLYDPSTGLVRFGARDYDPSLGRWTNKDPLDLGGDSTNLYAYAANDPVNRTDPTGLASPAPQAVQADLLRRFLDAFVNDLILAGNRFYKSDYFFQRWWNNWSAGVGLNDYYVCAEQAADAIRRMVSDPNFKGWKMQLADNGLKYTPFNHVTVKVTAPDGTAYIVDPWKNVVYPYSPSDTLGNQTVRDPTNTQFTGYGGARGDDALHY